MDDKLKQSLTRLMNSYNTMHLSGNGHDNRYYTKTEVDTFMKSIASTSALTQLEEKLDDEISRATSVENLKSPINSPAFTGIPIAPTAPLGTSTQQLATTEFVQSNMNDGILNSDALIIKGELGTDGDITSLPTEYKTGWTYRVIEDGTYAGHVCEVGDMITALVDRSEGDTLEDDDWWVIQANIDGAVTSITDGFLILTRNGNDPNIGIDHKDISRTDSVSEESLAFGGSFTAIKSIESDAKGHITKLLTTTFSIPYYTAGDGITLTGNKFNNSGVRSIGTGSSNGTISVDTNGVSTNVAVKGLGSAAFTGVTTASASTHTNHGTNGTNVPTMNFLSYWNGAYNSSGNSNLAYCNRGAFGTIVTKSSSDYAAASHSHSYLPLSGGTMTGNITYAGYGTCYIGNGSSDAANSVGGALNNLVISSWYGVSFTTSCSGQTYTGKNAVSINCRNGNVYAAQFNGALNGNASTATTLQTSRTINGTSFNGSGNITTANWGTSRTLTIGNTGKSVNGSGNVTWSLSEIGAAASSHSHNYAGSSSAGGHATYADNLYSAGSSSGAKLGYTSSYISLFADFNQEISIRGNGSSSGHTTGIFLCTYSDDTALFSPYTDNKVQCGSVYQRWSQVCAATSSIVTSDKNLKDNIKELDQRYKELFLKLTPVSFTFKDGTSGRTHIGFVAQDVEEAMDELGLSSLEFAGFCKDQMREQTKDENGDMIEVPLYNEDGTPKYIYSLRYEEFIGIITGVVQDLYADVKELKKLLQK